MYRKELHRFPPKGTVNQAKAAAAAVEKGQKHKSQAVAQTPKPAKERMKVELVVEMELTQDEIVKFLETLETFRREFLQGKPPMWQQLKKKTKEAAGLVKH